MRWLNSGAFFSREGGAPLSFLADGGLKEDWSLHSKAWARCPVKPARRRRYFRLNCYPERGSRFFDSLRSLRISPKGSRCAANRLNLTNCGKTNPSGSLVRFWGLYIRKHYLLKGRRSVITLATYSCNLGLPPPAYDKALTGKFMQFSALKVRQKTLEKGLGVGFVNSRVITACGQKP